MDIYRRIFEHNPDPLLVVDGGGLIANANARCEQATGYRREELIGRPVEILVPARYASSHAALREQYARDLRTRRMGERQRDLWVLCKDGRELPADIMISPLQSGGTHFFLCAIRDVSDRLAADEQRRRHIAELENLHERLKVLASHDDLTGLFNRRSFEEKAEWMLRTTVRRGACISLLMIDLDFFKRVNDCFGHPEGDRVLVAVGRALRETCRQSDLAARYGGEEFVVALPDTDAAGSLTAAENFRAAIAALGGLQCRVTASVGAATFCSLPVTPVAMALGDVLKNLIADVDRALYAAKAAGRNCVRHAAPPAT